MTPIEQYRSIYEEMFSLYIEKLFWDNGPKDMFLKKISDNYDCYVFGGIIVDYIQGKNSHRDIDIVVNGFDNKLNTYIQTLNGKKNSFGGFKIEINKLLIDIWPIEKTWAFKRNRTLEFFLPMQLPSTSFFNATSIIFSISEKKLYWNESFIKYISEKKIDILFEENPYPELCIVKTVDYLKDGCEISSNLKKYINQFLDIKLDKIDDIQFKHYGYLKYPKEEIKKIFFDIEENINKKSKIKEKVDSQYSLF
jgi:hypothetical protein